MANARQAPPEPQTETGTGPGAGLVALSLTKRQAPPEKPESIRQRTFIIVSFWAVVIFLGLPLWWKTTTIYRAQLPLEQMLDWAEGRSCRPEFPLRISIEAPSLPEPEASHLLRLTQHAIDDLNDFSAHHLRLQLVESLQTPNASQTAQLDTRRNYVGEEDAALTVRLFLDEPGLTPSSRLEAYAAVLNVHFARNQVPSTSTTSSTLASYIAIQLQEIFAEEQAMIAYVLSSAATSSSAAPLSPANTGASPSAAAPTKHLSRTLSPELTNLLARRSTRSFRYSPTYHLTFSLFTPLATPSSWDISSALATQLRPLLSSLAPLSNFTIDTQLQLYAALSPATPIPTYAPELSAYTLPSSSLSGFINAAEWPLSPSIGSAPTINFVIYIPAPSHSPLVVEGTNATSWLVPQWGSVVILNPPSSLSPSSSPGDANPKATFPAHLTPDLLAPALQTFSQHLLQLLHLPSTPASLPLRLSTLLRTRSLSLSLSASSTLGSLARLTLALPSISIPPSVSLSVNATMHHLTLACNDFRDGRFESALRNGQVAEEQAERGFFEKSMVGQVYFPDEHKVAVYLPLLGPVGVPLIMGAAREVQRLVCTWRASRGGVRP